MDESHFLREINAIPWEQPAGNDDYRNALLVFADWLEERGDPRAELIRLREGLLNNPTPEQRQLWEPRMQELIHNGVQPVVATWENSFGMKFCWCPPGKFMMGSPESRRERLDDEIEVSVTLTHGFWLGKYPVLQREWMQVMGTKPWEMDELGKSGDNIPTVMVTWNDALEFGQKLTAQFPPFHPLPSDWEFTLPTEAQWEYACRAGTGTMFNFGENDDLLEDYGWYEWNTWDNEEPYIHEAGQKKSNAWGLFDVHGTVFEWCQDCYAEKLAGGVNPVGPSSNSVRVLRGGSWDSKHMECRSVCRFSQEPERQFGDVGFRVALVPSGQQRNIS